MAIQTAEKACNRYLTRLNGHKRTYVSLSAFRNTTTKTSRQGSPFRIIAVPRERTAFMLQPVHTLSVRTCALEAKHEESPVVGRSHVVHRGRCNRRVRVETKTDRRRWRRSYSRVHSGRSQMSTANRRGKELTFDQRGGLLTEAVA